MTFQCGKFRHYRYSLKGPNLYENPILLASHPSRKLMRKSGRSWCPRGFQNLIWFNALVCKQMLAICGAAGTGGSTKCWTSSCWPLALASSGYPSATRWPAISSKRGQTMIFDYSLAAVVTAGLLFYLTYALLRPEQF